MFETNEVLGKPKGSTRAELNKRSENTRRLAKQFENFIFQLVDEIRDLAEKKGFVDKPVEKKKSLWKLFG